MGFWSWFTGPDEAEWQRRLKEDSEPRPERVPPQPRFCVDCRWCKKSEIGESRASIWFGVDLLCTRSGKEPPYDLATGRHRYKDLDPCRYMRDDKFPSDAPRKCGPEGRLFSPRREDQPSLEEFRGKDLVAMAFEQEVKFLRPVWAAQTVPADEQAAPDAEITDQSRADSA